jgi:putative redox protein
MRDVIIRPLSDTGLATHIEAGPHNLRSDEPVALGGTDSGATPQELLLAALGACTTITLRMYAARKGWPLREARLGLTASTVDGVFVIRRQLTLDGDLDDEQRARLHEIADRCPVHRAITGEVRVIDVAQGTPVP